MKRPRSWTLAVWHDRRHGRTIMHHATSLVLDTTHSQIATSQINSCQKFIERQCPECIVLKCGYNRNTKTEEILFGPLQYGSANFRHLYDQQGLGQLTFLFLRHWRQNTVAGQLWKNVVAWAQFTTGMATPILETPSVHIPHLESTRWLASLCNYLASINAEMHLDSTGLLQLEREHDGYIMEMIVQSQQYTDKETIRLNYCWLF